MAQLDRLWWQIYRSRLVGAIGLGLFLAFLFSWPSLHYGSSLLDRLPSWGWLVPVGLWLAVIGVFWWQHRRHDGPAT
jgi:hypothetical protein